MAGAGAGSKGQGNTGALAGAGAGTYNEITQTIEASIKGNSSVATTGGGVTVTATDMSEIDADAGGVAIAIAYGSGTGATGALSVGAATANNTIDSSVSAFVDTSSVIADGDVTLSAEAKKNPALSGEYRINALAFGVAVSGAGSTGTGLTGALAGAGSGATNTIDTRVSAHISESGGSKKVASNAGSVTLTANDESSIRADAGGFAVALSLSGSSGTGGGAGSVGAAISRNIIGTAEDRHWVKAYIESSDVEAAAGGVTLSATASTVIDALAMGGSLSGAGSSGSGATGALAGAGAGATNDVIQTIEASITNDSSITTTGNGGVSVSAIDSTSITADAGGVAVAVALTSGRGSGTGSGSIGAAISHNTVSSSVRAFLDGSSIIADGDVEIASPHEFEGFAGRGPVFVIRHIPAGDTDDPPGFRELAVAVALEKRRQELSIGEIARSAEHDEVEGFHGNDAAGHGRDRSPGVILASAIAVYTGPSEFGRGRDAKKQGRWTMRECGQRRQVDSEPFRRHSGARHEAAALHCQPAAAPRTTRTGTPDKTD